MVYMAKKIGMFLYKGLTVENVNSFFIINILIIYLIIYFFSFFCYIVLSMDMFYGGDYEVQ